MKNKKILSIFLAFVMLLLNFNSTVFATNSPKVFKGKNHGLVEVVQGSKKVFKFDKRLVNGEKNSEAFNKVERFNLSTSAEDENNTIINLTVIGLKGKKFDWSVFTNNEFNITFSYTDKDGNYKPIEGKATFTKLDYLSNPQLQLKVDWPVGVPIQAIQLEADFNGNYDVRAEFEQGEGSGALGNFVFDVSVIEIPNTNLIVEYKDIYGNDLYENKPNNELDLPNISIGLNHGVKFKLPKDNMNVNLRDWNYVESVLGMEVADGLADNMEAMTLNAFEKMPITIDGNKDGEFTVGTGNEAKTYVYNVKQESSNAPTIIKVTYAEDISIPPKGSNGQYLNKPEGYVRLTFDANEKSPDITKGVFEGEGDAKVHRYIDVKEGLKWDRAQLKTEFNQVEEPKAIKGDGTLDFEKSFITWNPTLPENGYVENKTFYAVYSKEEVKPPVIINPTENTPDGYVRIRFDKGSNGKLSVKDVPAKADGSYEYDILKNMKWGEVRETTPKLIVPTIISDTGWNVKTLNEGWSKKLPKDSDVITTDKVFIAQYELQNIVPGHDSDGNKVPNPYSNHMVKVTMDANTEIYPGAIIKDETFYWVKKGYELKDTDVVLTKAELNEASFTKWTLSKEKSATDMLPQVITQDTTLYAQFKMVSNPIIVDRVNGYDRYETAIEVSKKYYGTADVVIVVDGGNFPDALTASVLAKLLKAPILLTNTFKLDKRAEAEIERLGAKDVIIVGGRSSVSEDVRNELEKYDKDTVERVYGRDRYGTSAAVAKRVVGITGELGIGVVASGLDFADALTVGPYASREGYPILLVRQCEVPDSVQQAIKDTNITKVTIAGGNSCVSNELESKLPEVIERLSGETRYETAVDIASNKFRGVDKIFLTNGENWMDSLIISPVGGMLNMPILLTRQDEVPASLKEYIVKAKIKKITAVGGRSMISDRVLEELRNNK
ncbi:MAG: cell wall-binding repeat-containing protein [Lagierella massiliensis]|nr:cell wall-binding repeat-containing protein [Lagierella massiliensis]